MNTYSKCPSCGNNKNGDEIYKCRECGKVYCTKCGNDRFGDVCPKCDSGGYLRHGVIKN